MPFMAMRLERILQVYAPVTPPSCSDHEQVCTQSRNDIYVDVIVEEELPLVCRGHAMAPHLVPWPQQHLRVCVALDVRQLRVLHQGICKDGDVPVVKTHTRVNVILEQILWLLKLIIAGCH